MFYKSLFCIVLLDLIFCSVVQLAQARRTRLEESLTYRQFEDDAEEEDSWALDKLRTLEAMPIPKAARQAAAAQQKAKVCCEKLLVYG